MDFVQRFERVLGGKIPGDIVCGDCLDVMGQMPDGCVDLVVTSPPYFHLKDYKISLGLASLEDYLEWLGHIAHLLFKTLSPDGFLVFIVGLYVQFNGAIHLPSKAAVLLEQEGFILTNELIWHKPKGCQGLWTMAMTRWLKGKTDQPIFANQHEYVQIWHKGKRKKLAPHGEDFIKRVAWSIQEHRVSTYQGHPCPFPESLISDLIKCYSVEGNLVFDPFMGSGTTAVVAGRLGRNFFGCDINPDYVKMSLGRISKDRLRRSQLSLEGI